MRWGHYKSHGRTDNRFSSIFTESGKKDYYEIMGVERGADHTSIKKAYQKKVLTLHPDHNKSESATQEFIELKDAYDVLSDTKTRAKYDACHQQSFFCKNNDSNVSPEQAQSLLQQFFDLYFEKRGCPAVINKVSVEKGPFKTHEGLLYLEIVLKHQSIRLDSCHNALFDCFNQLRRDPLLNKALSIECLQAEGEEDATGTLVLNVYLNNANLIREAINSLKKENPFQALDLMIQRKLRQNPNDLLALSALKVQQDVITALNNKELSDHVATRVVYLTYSALLSPKSTVYKDCMTFIERNEHGNTNWWKIIGGSLIAFCGAACLIALLGIAIQPVIGIPLLAASGILSGLGCYLAIEGRKKGIAKSFGIFHEAAQHPNTIDDESAPAPLYELCDTSAPAMSH